jgi:predicted Zn finger-like uncharacterized protein
MNVSCPQCSTVYRVDPAKVPPGGVRARCSSCGGVIPVGMTAAEHPAAPTPQPYGGAGTTQPASAIPLAPPTRQRYPTPPRPATLPPLRPTPRAPWPSVATPSSPGQIHSAPVWPGTPAPSAGAPVSVPPFTPPAPPPVTPRPPAQPAPAASSSMGSGVVSGVVDAGRGIPGGGTAPASGAGTWTSSTTSAPPGPGERRPINPFLARDPSLRAKRLARALVSDMVAYYPAKHSEGLQRGTLKELFREEIKKSYEEYVSQVGSDLARTTTHFQEALNEVLGAGKRIF